MGVRHRKAPSQEQQSLAQTQKDLLDSQEISVGLFEDNTNLKQQVLDLQEMVVALAEKGGVA